MLNREAVLAGLRRLHQNLEGRGIARAGVFGSIARDKAKGTSDIDIIVTPQGGRRLDLIDLGGVQTLLEEQFNGAQVDIVVVSTPT